MNQSLSIERPVGAGETNRSSDLETVRDALAEHGLCLRSVTGQRNAKFKPDLTAGIRIFRRQAGLDPDGLVIPGGPTAMALGLGGEVQVVSAPTEGKKVDCAALRKLVEVAAEQLESMALDVHRLEKLRLTREGELGQIMSTLGQMARGLRLGIDPNIRNLDAVSRALNNLPNDRDVQQAQGTLRRAREKIEVIQDLEHDLAFLIDQRNKAQQRLDQRISRFNRLCPAA